MNTRYECSLFPHSVVTKSRKGLKERVGWGIKSLRIGMAWKHSRGKGIRIAVLDTGIARGHPDLIGSIAEYKDFTGDGIVDRDGHGTHVAGIIAARDNSIGVVGVAPESKLLIGKVLDNNSYGRSKWIAKGIQWAISQGADIISMSLGSRIPIRAVKRTIKDAPRDVYFVAAVGNAGPKKRSVCYPAAYGEVIAVGAIDRRKKVTKWSSRGTSVQVVAPGDNIISAYPPKALARMSGTSMACPIVAGVMALALAKHKIDGGQTPITNRAQMLEHLIKSCRDIGDRGKDKLSGYGLINPKKMLA